MRRTCYLILFLSFCGSCITHAIASSIDSLVIKKSNSWTYKLYDPDMNEFSFELSNPNEYIVKDTALISTILNRIENLEEMDYRIPYAVEGKILCMEADSLCRSISINSMAVFCDDRTFITDSLLTSFIDSVCALSSKRTLKPKDPWHPTTIPYPGGYSAFKSYFVDRVKQQYLDKEDEHGKYFISIFLRLDKNGIARKVYIRDPFNYKRRVNIPPQLETVIEQIIMDTYWEKNKNRRVTDLVAFTVLLVFNHKKEN